MSEFESRPDRNLSLICEIKMLCCPAIGGKWFRNRPMRSLSLIGWAFFVYENFSPVPFLGKMGSLQ